MNLKEAIEYKSDDITYKKEKSQVYFILKRIFDIIVSFIALIVLLPVFLIISVIVKLSSKGPVFFTHERLGLNNKYIKIYKFRTMVSGAENMIDLLTEEQQQEYAREFKITDDPRITKAGNILRKTSLDELPQLINILKGDLSIVGPRPIVKAELKNYEKYADRLLSVKPGLTGYWQTHGRSDVSYSERVKMDMYYIDNRSLWMDIKIIFKTFAVVFQKKGAR